MFVWVCMCMHVRACLMAKACRLLSSKL
uniref:Uncharacterized protein n=1 Tax=Anguilla anguilla TaxID=7936 RepID=A0A0E9US15_ANGAN